MKNMFFNSKKTKHHMVREKLKIRIWGKMLRKRLFEDSALGFSETA